MDSIRRHLSLGKPVIGIRTASHAFELRKESSLKGHQQWPEWDQSVIGGNYQGHHGKGKVCLVNNLSSSSNHPILKGQPANPHSSLPLSKFSPAKSFHPGFNWNHTKSFPRTGCLDSYHPCRFQNILYFIGSSS